jgi:steroid delta-isomerase-like uncharacterized protein
VDQLHAEDFVDGSPAGRASDRESYKAGIAGLYEAFPDFEATTDDLVIDEGANRVAVRWSATGTHRGTFLGIAPTGKEIVFRGIEIIAIQNDRIVERWGEWDGLDILAQLGVRFGPEA